MVEWIPLAERLPKLYEEVVVLCMDAPSPAGVPNEYHPTHTNRITGVSVDSNGNTQIRWEDEMEGATHWVPADEFWADFEKELQAGAVGGTQYENEEDMMNAPISEALKSFGFDSETASMADLDNYLEMANDYLDEKGEKKEGGSDDA